MVEFNLKEKFKHGCMAWKYISFKIGDLDAATQIFFNNIATTLAVTGSLTRSYDPTLTASDKNGWTTLFEKYPELRNVVDDNIQEYVYKRTVVGLAISLLIGSLYYIWMALRLSASKKSSVVPTALPFGINTPAAFTFVAVILGPTALNGFDNCYEDYVLNSNNINVEELKQCMGGAVHNSWQAGVLSNFACGLISAALSLFGKMIVKFTPRVSLLSSLACVGFAFLAASQITLNFADPVSGFVPITIMIMGYFCGVKFWKLPVTITTVAVAAALSWATGFSKPEEVTSTITYIKPIGVSTGFTALSDWSPVSKYFGVIFPFAVQSAVGTLMNVVSAEKAGDFYPVTEAMVTDGLASCIGSIFATPLMVSVYIGHPGFKDMGATTSYTLYNGIAFFLFAIFGLFALINGIFPEAALAPVITFIGLIICSEAMEDLPKRHFIVFIIGIIPGILTWAVQNGLQPFSASSTFGVIAVGNDSYMFFSMCFTALIAYLTDRNFLMAGIWALFSGVMSSIGLLHQSNVAFDKFSTPHGPYCIEKSVNNIFYGLAFKNNGTECTEDWLPCETDSGEDSCGWKYTVQWRFLLAYGLISVWIAIFWGLQKSGRFPHLEQIKDEKEEPIYEKNQANLKNAIDAFPSQYANTSNIAPNSHSTKEDIEIQ